MISRGSWRLSRKCANGKRRRRLVLSFVCRLAPRPPRTPRPDTKSRRGAALRAARGPGSWRGRAARELGHLRAAGAAAAAQVRSRLSPTWRGGGSLEATGAPSRAVERRAVPGAALGSREGGSGPAPEAISFVQVT